jgi:hypothetical protein
MPISEYFGGHGEEVLRDMKEKYGPEKGEEVFYATANKEHQKPAEDADRRARLHDMIERCQDEDISDLEEYLCGYLENRVPEQG